MSQKIHPFFRQTAGEAQALYERKRIADMLICSNWMRNPTLTVKATFTSGEVNFNNSIIDHFRLSDFQTQTIPKLASESIQLVLKSSHHTAFGFTDFHHHFSKRDQEVGGCRSRWRLVGEDGCWCNLCQFLKAVNARGTALCTKLSGSPLWWKVVAGPENWKDVTTHVNRMYIIRSEMKDANALLLTVVCFFDVQAILDSLDASQSWPPAFSSTLF